MPEINPAYRGLPHSRDMLHYDPQNLRHRDIMRKLSAVLEDEGEIAPGLLAIDWLGVGINHGHFPIYANEVLIENTVESARTQIHTVGTSEDVQARMPSQFRLRPGGAQIMALCYCCDAPDPPRIRYEDYAPREDIDRLKKRIKDLEAELERSKQPPPTAENEKPRRWWRRRRS